MKKLRVLVTGGPTRAYLDEVRFISNYSTGELAFRTAASLRKKGIAVAAVVGPTAFDFKALRLAKLSAVQTSAEMHAEVLRLCAQFKPDVVVFAAAVLDFVPAKKLAGKVSSKLSSWNIQLKPTPKTIDIVGRKFPHIRRVGFKLEWKKPTGSVELWGAAHREARGLDALVLNYLPQVGKRAHHAYLFDRHGRITTASRKQQIADWIVRQSLPESPRH